MVIGFFLFFFYRGNLVGRRRGFGTWNLQAHRPWVVVEEGRNDEKKHTHTNTRSGCVFECGIVEVVVVVDIRGRFWSERRTWVARLEASDYLC